MRNFEQPIKRRTSQTGRDREDTMAATRNDSTSRISLPIKRQMAALKSQAETADYATLEYPELPDCMRECARKRMKRMEGKRCPGPQMQLRPTTEG